jgi:putative membrane protein
VTRAALLLCGIGISVLAVSPPAESTAELSLRNHMVQHMVLMMVAAPLIAAGATRALLGAGPRRFRRWVARVTRSQPLRVLLSAPVAWAVFAAVQWIVHLPDVIAIAERSHPTHAALHAALLAAAVLFWLPIASPGPPPRPRPAVRVAYLLTAMPVGDALAVWLMSVPRPLYEGVSLQDQRDAATVMLAGSLVLGVAAAATAWRGLAHEHRRQVRREELEVRRA